jgi:importin subunit beta-1
LSTDAATRDRIKQESLSTLGSPSAKAGGVAAQVVAAIAAVELPHDRWPELIGSLLGFVNNPQAASNLKISTLQAIGFICEAIVCTLLEFASLTVSDAIA